RRAAARYQSADASTASARCECRDAREALPGTRAAGYFSQTEATSRNSGGRPKGVFHSICVRSVFEKMDSAAMAVVPPHRRESSGRGKVAKNTFLAERGKALGTRKQGEDPQFDECLVFPRHSVGVDGEESNHKGT